MKVRTTIFVLLFAMLSFSMPVFAVENLFQGTHRLNSFAAGMIKPGMRAKRTLKPSEIKQTGESETFYTFNFSTNKWENTDATLMLISSNLYVYLESSRDFDRAMMQRFVDEFENRIYPKTTRYFGSEARPGIDNDNHITILLMDIKDEFDKTGTYTSGYFNRGDCYRPDEIPEGVNLKSNQREMLYVDISPADIESDELFATIAHELQHLIHFYHDVDEYDWLNESCSQICTYLCGYGHPRQLQAYLKNPDNSLLAWAPWNQVANYGQVYLWSYYLMIRFCNTDEERVAFFQNLVKDPQNGMLSFNIQLKQFDADFSSVFSDFCIAGFLNRPGLLPQAYSFGSELPEFQLPATAFADRLPTMYRNSVSLWGADLIKAAVAPGEIEVGFAGDLTNLPNSFTVALVFFNETDSRVEKTEFIENIKSTTDRVRVMLPGDNDGFPPPPPVKTQMGSISTFVPDRCNMLYLVIMGKGPADLEDSMLAWSGKANYRVDIKATPKSTTDFSSINSAILLRNYAALTGESHTDSDFLQSLADEIFLMLKAESELADRPLAEKILAEDDFAGLHKLVNDFGKFSELHSKFKF